MIRALGLLAVASVAGCGAPAIDAPPVRSAAAWFRAVNLTGNSLDVKKGANALFAELGPHEGRPFIPMSPKPTEVELDFEGGSKKARLDLKSGTTLTLFVLPGKGGIETVAFTGEPRRGESGSSTVQLVRLAPGSATLVSPGDLAFPGGLAGGGDLKLAPSTKSLRLKDGASLPLDLKPATAYSAVFPDPVLRIEPFVVVNSSPTKPMSANAGMAG